jgi:hypothetical protein
MKAFKEKMRPLSLAAASILMASLAFSNSAKSDVMSDVTKITGDLTRLSTPAEFELLSNLVFGHFHQAAT